VVDASQKRTVYASPMDRYGIHSARSPE